MSVQIRQPGRRPRQRGALRGLSLNNMLAPSATQRTTEQGDGEGAGETASHNTRAARNGKTAVNYNMKYHPMDDVTRPRRANQMSGTRSASVETLRENDSDETTNDEIDLLSDREDSGDSDEDGDDAPAQSTQREPDPRATRRSERSEAHKLVDYSRKRHPQDRDLPGYQHLARAQKRKKALTSRSSEPVTAKRAAENTTVAFEPASNVDSRNQKASSSRPPKKKMKTPGRSLKHQEASAKLSARTALEASSDSTASQVDDLLLGRHFAYNAGPEKHPSSTARLMATMDQLMETALHEVQSTSLGTRGDITPTTFFNAISDNVAVDTRLPSFTIIRPYLKPQTVDAHALPLPTPAKALTDPSSSTKDIPHARDASDDEIAAGHSENLRQRLLASTQQKSEENTARHVEVESNTNASEIARQDVLALPTPRQSSHNTNVSEDQNAPSHFEDAMAVTPSRAYSDDDQAAFEPNSAPRPYGHLEESQAPQHDDGNSPFKIPSYQLPPRSSDGPLLDTQHPSSSSILSLMPAPDERRPSSGMQPLISSDPTGSDRIDSEGVQVDGSDLQE